MGITDDIRKAMYKGDGGGLATATTTTTAYIAPEILTFVNDINNIEIGSTVTEVVFDWTRNKTVSTQSLDNGIGSILGTLNTYTHTDTFTTSRTYTLTIDDGSYDDTATSSVSFLPKRYWGVSANASLNDAQIIALSSELSSSRGKTLPTLSPSTQYIYYCYPASEGLVTSITVNGLLDNSWDLTVQSHINASGYTQDYNVYRSANLLAGTYNVVVV